jgi:hypothetical protein
MAGINLASKYASKLDQLFAKGSYTDRAVNQNYDFDGVKTINVYTVTTVATHNYNRSETGDRFGGNSEIQDVVTPYTLNNDKCFKLTIDRGNYEQQALAKKAGEVLRAEMDEQVIPEIDANRIAAGAAGAAAVSQAVSAGDNVSADFMKANAYLDEAKAPVSNRFAFVTPQMYVAIKSKIVSTVNATAYNDKLLPRGFVGELDGVNIIVTPQSYFPANTKCVMWHKDALLGAKQIMKTRIITDSELVDGSVLTGRFIYDSFVLNGKKNAVASITSSTISG